MLRTLVILHHHVPTNDPLLFNSWTRNSLTVWTMAVSQQKCHSCHTTFSSVHHSWTRLSKNANFMYHEFFLLLASWDFELPKLCDDLLICFKNTIFKIFKILLKRGSSCFSPIFKKSPRCILQLSTSRLLQEHRSVPVRQLQRLCAVTSRWDVFQQVHGSETRCQKGLGNPGDTCVARIELQTGKYTRIRMRTLEGCLSQPFRGEWKWKRNHKERNMFKSLKTQTQMKLHLLIANRYPKRPTQQWSLRSFTPAVHPSRCETPRQPVGKHRAQRTTVCEDSPGRYFSSPWNRLKHLTPWKIQVTWDFYSNSLAFHIKLPEFSRKRFAGKVPMSMSCDLSTNADKIQPK